MPKRANMGKRELGCVCRYPFLRIPRTYNPWATQRSRSLPCRGLGAGEGAVLGWSQRLGAGLLMDEPDGYIHTDIDHHAAVLFVFFFPYNFNILRNNTSPASFLMGFHGMKVKVKLLSQVQLFVTPWAVAYQAPLSMGFSRQEYWSGLPFPTPGDLPDPEIEPRSPTL